NQTGLHYPSVEKRPDELKYALVGNPFRDARHQNIVIDSVEKFFEINVDHDVEAFGDIPLRLGHGLMGGTSRAEAVAMLGERWIQTFLQDLKTACWISRPTTHGMPIFLPPPPGLVISTRLTGCG